MKMNNFAKNLTALLKVNGLTQTEFAKKIGYKQQSISMYTTGTNEPPISTAVKIANMFDISLDELITGDKYETKSVRELLNFNDLEIENLNKFSKNPLAHSLFDTEKFAEVFSKVVTSFGLNINSRTVVDSNGATVKNFNELIATQSALEMYNFFKEFFMANTRVLQARTHERAKSILSAMPDKV